MKIAVASVGNPESVKTWSGIPTHIISALKSKGHKTLSITLHYPKEPWYYNWLRRIHYRLYNKWFLSEVEEVILKQIGQQFDLEVDRLKPDVVLCIHGDWLSHITFKQPTILLHDATFATLVDYYPSFTNLTSRSVRAGNEMYGKALKRVDAAVFSSHWASKSAVQDYKTPVSKVYTIPLGANLIKLPTDDSVTRWINSRAKSNECNFLFLGVDWERKGGPDALDFVAALNRLGILSRLIIVGCSPKIPTSMQSFVECKGFLRKDIPAEANLIEKALIESHALILPSLAECYGCVYCEANAYGLPALGRDTGGISEIIKDNINGLLLKRNESITMFANRWAAIWNNKTNYLHLSTSSHKEFEKRLNYNTFVNELELVIKKIV